MKVDISQSV